HDEDALGNDLRAQALAHLEKLAALQQPFLQAFQSADVFEIFALGDKLDHAASVYQQTFFFEQRRDRLRTQLRVRGQRAPQRVTYFVERQPLQRARDLLQGLFAYLSSGRQARCLVAQI